MLDFVAKELSKSTSNNRELSRGERRNAGMERSVHDARGRRKYLLPIEVQRFLLAALIEGGETATLCAVLAFTGARVSEALALTPERIDNANCEITFRTLKKRGRIVNRSLTMPRMLIALIDREHHFREARLDEARAQERLWQFSRTTAWRRVKRIMLKVGVPAYLATPRALRHAMATTSRMRGIDIDMIKEWLGHRDIKTTAIYSTVTGTEARALFRSVSRHLTRVLSSVAMSDKLRRKQE